MSATSSIEWTQATWNPVTGCDKVSPGCAHCYAETFAKRFEGVPGHPYEQGFKLTRRPERLELPLKWRKPRMIFVNSMSDLFHEKVPAEFVGQVFDTMRRADWHTFQVLTKRPERALELTPQLPPWPDNVWMGVSVENRRFLHRLDTLRDIPAAIRFASCEPLLGPLDGINLADIDWVIAGGESGPRARRMKPEWACALRDACLSEASPSSSSSGARTTSRASASASRAGRQLAGRLWDGMPTAPSRGCPYARLTAVLHDVPSFAGTGKDEVVGNCRRSSHKRGPRHHVAIAKVPKLPFIQARYVLPASPAHRFLRPRCLCDRSPPIVPEDSAQGPLIPRNHPFVGHLSRTASPRSVEK